MIVKESERRRTPQRVNRNKLKYQKSRSPETGSIIREMFGQRRKNNNNKKFSELQSTNAMLKN